MQVSFATEPTPGVVNEDYVLALPELVCVLDGVTAPAELETGCVHGTPWYVRRLATRLALAHAAGPADTLCDLVSTAIAEIRTDHQGLCDLSHPGTPSSTVCMLRTTTGRADWLVLSDSPLVLDRAGVVEVVTDHRLRQTSAREREAVAAGTAPVGTAEHRAQVLALVEAQRPYRNQPGGYWLAAAIPEAGQHAVTGSVPTIGRERLTRAALLSDGASRAVDVFGLYGWSGLLDRAQTAGPASVISDVRTAEALDPRGDRHPRGKAHDDATAAFAILDTQGGRP
ncbi:hypothetical protein [Cryptosporangium aurantiacum]|uniref:Protein phosphatase 2C n=1 Tax=Cryptosporangium aurantiacum TaxID=134849 RepID=A0A1M7RJH7_9ACTN|nr:hypothetical protein [Cryptosporangium aurantiacum]SHN46457.1 hypothetical protein SAMN05443668_115146 [Cryptosporangium aurantiacum]